MSINGENAGMNLHKGKGRGICPKDKHEVGEENHISIVYWRLSGSFHGGTQ